MTLSAAPNTRAAVEVRTCFLRYERALRVGDVPVLDELFLDAPQTSRFGIADRQSGPQELRAWRSAHPDVPAGRTLSDTCFTQLCDDAVVVTTCFSYPDRAIVGRQTQVWMRTRDGWRIVHAHVSEVPDPSPVHERRGVGEIGSIASR